MSLRYARPSFHEVTMPAKEPDALSPLLLPLLLGAMAPIVFALLAKRPDDKAAPQRGTDSMEGNISSANVEILCDVLADRIAWHRRQEKANAESAKQASKERDELRARLLDAQAKIEALESLPNRSTAVDVEPTRKARRAG